MLRGLPPGHSLCGWQWGHLPEPDLLQEGLGCREWPCLDRPAGDTAEDPWLCSTRATSGPVFLGSGPWDWAEGPAVLSPVARGGVERGDTGLWPGLCPSASKSTVGGQRDTCRHVDTGRHLPWILAAETRVAGPTGRPSGALSEPSIKKKTPASVESCSTRTVVH